MPAGKDVYYALQKITYIYRQRFFLPLCWSLMLALTLPGCQLLSQNGSFAGKPFKNYPF